MTQHKVSIAGVEYPLLFRVRCVIAFRKRYGVDFATFLRVLAMTPEDFEKAMELAPTEEVVEACRGFRSMEPEEQLALMIWTGLQHREGRTDIDPDWVLDEASLMEGRLNTGAVEAALNAEFSKIQAGDDEEDDDTPPFTSPPESTGTTPESTPPSSGDSPGTSSSTSSSSSTTCTSAQRSPGTPGTTSDSPSPSPT